MRRQFHPAVQADIAQSLANLADEYCGLMNVELADNHEAEAAEVRRKLKDDKK